MGLFSGGNSRSTTEVFNTTQNTSFSELGGGNAASIQGDGNAVSFLDGGAIKEAFSFAERTNSDAINVVSGVAENAGRQTQEAVKAVSESVRTGAENIINQFGTYAAIAAVGFVVLKLFKA
ncbi:hypothetical protein [Zhongshania sp. BJYM1]|uniref:hypothetical protein n=1 Tax=Zhongshania aquatica TaxID=2965069 RepID=UPI0022B54FA6|nr:hypothetical protein [Marortus sp. BJYM1]